MPEHRLLDHYEGLAGRLDGHPHVRDVTVVDGADPHVEVVLAPRLSRVPPSVCRIVGGADFGIADVSPQGPTRQLVVVVA